MLPNIFKAWKKKPLALLTARMLKYSALALLGGLLAILILGRYGWLAQRDLKKQISQQQQNIQNLKQKKITRIWQIKALKNDPQYIEHLARKKMGLVYPSDKIYR